MKQNDMRYPAEFRMCQGGQPEGGRYRNAEWVVRFPGLEGALTGGASLAEAETEAADCLGSWLAHAIAERSAIPAPGPARRGQRLVAVPLWIAPKVALYQAMRSAGISNSELARRLGVRENVVRRMLDPDHATRLAKIEQALLAAGAHLYLAVVLDPAADRVPDAA